MAADAIDSAEQDRAARIAKREKLFRDLALAMERQDCDEPITQPIPVIRDVAEVKSWLRPG